MVLTTSIALQSSKHQYAYMDFMTTYARVACRRAVVVTQGCPHLKGSLTSDFLVSLYQWDRVWSREGGLRLHSAHMLKLSPQPHVPLMLGLLKTNSLDSFDSTKSISVPRRVSWAFFAINTLTPEKRSEQYHHYYQVIALWSAPIGEV